MNRAVDDAEAVIRRAFDVWNRGDLDEYLTFYDPDLDWDLNGVKGQGFGRVPEILRAQLAAFPDTRMEIAQVISDGDRAAVEATSTGTNTGSVARPGSAPRPPTGKKVWRAVAIFVRVRGGRIVEFREYSPQPQLIDQL